MAASSFRAPIKQSMWNPLAPCSIDRTVHHSLWPVDAGTWNNLCDLIDEVLYIPPLKLMCAFFVVNLPGFVGTGLIIASIFVDDGSMYLWAGTAVVVVAFVFEIWCMTKYEKAMLKDMAVICSDWSDTNDNTALAQITGGCIGFDRQYEIEIIPPSNINNSTAVLPTAPNSENGDEIP